MPAAPLYPAEFRSALTSAAQRKPRTYRRGVSIPEHVSAHVKLVFSEMSRMKITYDEVEERSGVRRPTIKQWRRKNKPGLESLEAVLATLGHAFVPVPALETLPAELAGELTALALKLRMNIPQTWCALLDIHTEQKLLRLRSEDRAAILAEHDARRARHANDNKPRKRASPTT